MVCLPSLRPIRYSWSLLGMQNRTYCPILCRAFVEGGTHNTDFDGVCFYQRESLPGYSAIFKHPNDELNYCYYLIPCGKDGMCGNVKVGCTSVCAHACAPTLTGAVLN
jgi:hypothetical protein